MDPETALIAQSAGVTLVTRRLLVAQPRAAADLRGLLAELSPGGTTGPVITQHATASGRARVRQAGRDRHHTRR
ncbi:hypothetical protein ACE1SV_27900 [Streptomyces sp. E-15]